VIKKKTGIITAIFPALLSIGIFTIPFVSDYTDHLVTEAAAGQMGRWFWGHIISGFAFGISILAAHNITEFLNSENQHRSGSVSLLLIVIGGTLFAMGLGADGIGPAATISGGSQAYIFFEGSGMMVTGIFIAGVILFGFGLINQIIGLQHTGLVSKTQSIILIFCAAIFMGASAIPSTLGLYIIALISIFIYGNLSYLFLRSPKVN
jgi:hypothetical protein